MSHNLKSKSELSKQSINNLRESLFLAKKKKTTKKPSMCIGYETSCSIALLSSEKNYTMNSFREYLENRRHTEVEQEKKAGEDGQRLSC